MFARPSTLLIVLLASILVLAVPVGNPGSSSQVEPAQPSNSIPAPGRVMRAKSRDLTPTPEQKPGGKRRSVCCQFDVPVVSD